jgi:hypothetical protein
VVCLPSPFGAMGNTNVKFQVIRFKIEVKYELTPKSVTLFLFLILGPSNIDVSSFVNFNGTPESLEMRFGDIICLVAIQVFMPVH